jgi:hypothetical protein
MNVFEVHKNARVVEYLIYGQWRWSLTLHRADRDEDQLSYEQAKTRGLEIQDLKPTPLPNGIQRTKTWTEVVQHIQKLERIKQG